MININLLKELRTKLENDEFDLEELKSLIFEEKDTRSWHTKEWKEFRGKRLKDSCEQCGNKEEFTIQHTWHPDNYEDIKYRISLRYRDILREEYTIDKLVTDLEVFEYFTSNYKQEVKGCCPKCDSYNLLIRKITLPKYRCNKCKYNFDIAEEKLFPQLIDDREVKEVCNNTTIIAFTQIRKKVYSEKIGNIKSKEYSIQIEKETLIQVIEENIRYQSLEETLTYCKRCAFMYDKNGMDLCPKCKKQYKKIRYETCNVCKFGEIEE